MHLLTSSENIVDNRLVYFRKKTKKLIKLPLQERAIQIIQYYQRADRKYIFPILSDAHITELQKRYRIHDVIADVNKYLKEIGKELNIPIAAKTGTVGKGKDNIDAWCVAYTPEEVCATWVGNLDNTPITVAGGNQPARCVKNYFSASTTTSSPFVQPGSVVEREIDLISLENSHKLELASPNTPARFKQSALFSIFNLPKDISQNFVEIGETKFEVKNNGSTVDITFAPLRHLTYKFYDGKTLIKEISDQTQPQQLQLKVKGKDLKIIVGFDNKNQKTYDFKLKKEADSQPQNDKWFI